MGERCRRPKGKRLQRAQRVLRDQHQVLSKKRTMHHKAIISFDATRIIFVIMDPVTVECQGRVPKQERR